MKRTALARRNQIECSSCDEDIQDRSLARRVQYGFWDHETQNFENGALQRHYCEACWREEFGRDIAAHYEVQSAQRLWDVLEAADGRLVADLRPIFVSGRPWIRVQDGELQALNSTVVDSDQEADPPIIEFGVEVVDADREWFDRTFRAERELPDDEMPTIALLKPTDETPFDGWDELPEDQQTLGDVEVGEA